MGRKRRDQEKHRDQKPKQDETGEHRPRRGRRLALLLALAGLATYLVRRNQRKAELDEGIWHEAPTATTPSTATSPAPTV
jgi:hypothetical protein